VPPDIDSAPETALRLLRTALFSLVFGFFSWLPAVQADGAAAAVVNGFHDALLNNMQHGKEYGCDGRIKHLGPIVDSSFDVAAIAQTVMRRHWGELSDAQHQQLIAAFRDYTVDTYASQFSSFGGEVFSVQDTQALPNGDQLVHARLKLGSGDLVAFDYVLHGQNGSWRIINVIADGVSDLALRSTQYNKLYEQKDNGGFNGLIAWLQDQIKKTRADCK
jgi:phospholipid transport system substrate-binding protein